MKAFIKSSLVFALAFSLVGCSSSRRYFTQAPDIDVSHGVKVFQQEGVTVWFMGVEENVQVYPHSSDPREIYGTLINFAVTDTGKGIDAYIPYFSVNGTMTYLQAPTTFSSTPGMWTYTEIVITSEYLDYLGITSICNIEFAINLAKHTSYDSDTGTYTQTVFETEPIKLTIANSSTSVQPVDDSGLEVFNENGIRVVIKPYEFDQHNTLIIRFFIENKSGSGIWIGARAFDAGGFSDDLLCNAWFYHRSDHSGRIFVQAGKVAYNSINPAHQLEDQSEYMYVSFSRNEVNNIESILLSLEIYEATGDEIIFTIDDIVIK